MSGGCKLNTGYQNPIFKFETLEGGRLCIVLSPRLFCTPHLYVSLVKTRPPLAVLCTNEWQTLARQNDVTPYTGAPGLQTFVAQRPVKQSRHMEAVYRIWPNSSRTNKCIRTQIYSFSAVAFSLKTYRARFSRRGTYIHSPFLVFHMHVCPVRKLLTMSTALFLFLYWPPHSKCPPTL